MSELPPLARGQNSVLPAGPAGPVGASVTAVPGHPIDVLGFLLGPDGKVRSDSDFVFFNTRPRAVNRKAPLMLDDLTHIIATAANERPRCATVSTREQLRLAIVTWIERTYQRKRRQRRLGKLTPIEFETINQTVTVA